MATTPLSAFFEQNLIIIIIVMAIPILIIYLYKMFQKVPPQPDYIKIFQRQIIADEALNKPDKKYGLKTLWRGHEFLGKIRTTADGFYEVAKRSEIPKMGYTDRKGNPYELAKEKARIFTITFKPFKFNLWPTKIKICWGKEMLKFSEKDDFFVEEKGKLVFPSDCAFTAMGKIYSTLGSFERNMPLISSEYNKLFWASTNNLMSSQMSAISSIKPEFAFQLSLERERLLAMQEAKKLKTSSII